MAITLCTDSSTINEVYISARAIDEVNVQVMMEKMGGGGHMNIAGAQVKASPDEVERMLKDIIDQGISGGKHKMKVILLERRKSNLEKRDRS